MSRANYEIFEEGSPYWNLLTSEGTQPVPEHVKSIVKHKGIIIESKKHPIKPLEEGKWMVNYSETV